MAKKKAAKRKSASTASSKKRSKKKANSKKKAEAKLAQNPLDVIPLEERSERPRGTTEIPAHLAANNRRQQNTKEYARRVQNARD